MYKSSQGHRKFSKKIDNYRIWDKQLRYDCTKEMCPYTLIQLNTNTSLMTIDITKNTEGVFFYYKKHKITIIKIVPLCSLA